MSESECVKRVLHVEMTTDGTVGGSHFCLLYLVSRLDKARFESVVLFYEHNSLIARFQKSGTKVIVRHLRSYVMWGPAIIRKAINAVLHVWMVLSCVEILHRERIHLVHLNNSVTGDIDKWIPACMLLCIPCVTHQRGIDSSGKVISLLQRVLSKYYSYIFPVSNAVKRHLMACGFEQKRLTTIYDGIDPEQYRARVVRSSAEVRKEFGIPDGACLVGLVGNIREWKGQELLLNALALLRDSHPDIYCLFVGSTARGSASDECFKERLEAMIRGNGLSDRVKLTGYRADVPDIVNACDILTNPSTQPEPFGMVIVEAMALGKPVIATDLGAAPEILEDGVSGAVVPVDAQALANRIGFFAANPAHAFNVGESATKRVQRFGIEANVALLTHAYEAILTNKHGA